MSVDVTTRGPLFDGRASRAVDAYLDEAKRQVAQEGVNDVRAELGRVLRNPTGYYASQIQTSRQVDGMAVTDGGVVYGPWLAGASSRNQSTRFKGYTHWRRAGQRLRVRAGDIAKQVLPAYMGGMR